MGRARGRTHRAGGDSGQADPFAPVFGRGRGRTEKEKDRVSVVAELLPADLIPAELNLVGIDGNAGSIIGEVARALKKAGNSRATIDAVRLEMMAGDYDHLLVVALSVTTPSDE